MKKVTKTNLLIFVFLIVLPHLIRIYYGDSVRTETHALLQYSSLVVSFVGGLLVVVFNFKNRNRSGSNAVSTLFIMLGSIVSLLSIFLLFLIYSLRGGVGF